MAPGRRKGVTKTKSVRVKSTVSKDSQNEAIVPSSATLNGLKKSEGSHVLKVEKLQNSQSLELQDNTNICEVNKTKTIDAGRRRSQSTKARRVRHSVLIC